VREIVRALKKSLMDAEIVVIGGGLGPTADDLTREAVAETCGVALEEREDLAEGLEARFAAMGKPMPAANRQPRPNQLSLLPVRRCWNRERQERPLHLQL